MDAKCNVLLCVKNFNSRCKYFGMVECNTMYKYYSRQVPNYKSSNRRRSQPSYSEMRRSDLINTHTHTYNKCWKLSVQNGTGI